MAAYPAMPGAPAQFKLSAESGGTFLSQWASLRAIRRAISWQDFSAPRPAVPASQCADRMAKKPTINIAANHFMTTRLGLVIEPAA
jgi:hypothetical protein